MQSKICFRVLSPHTWEGWLVELPWLLFTQSCFCQAWFLKHSVSSTCSLVLARLEPKCVCFLFTGLLWRKGEDRPDRNRQSNQTAVNNYMPTSTRCSEQRAKQTNSAVPRSLTYSAQHAWSKAASPPTPPPPIFFPGAVRTVWCSWCSTCSCGPLMTTLQASAKIPEYITADRTQLPWGCFVSQLVLHRSAKPHLLCPFCLCWTVNFNRVMLDLPFRTRGQKWVYCVVIFSYFI